MIAAALVAVTLTGIPTDLHDGDTFHIAGERVRLVGIDAPEADQTCTRADGDLFACGFVATRILEHLLDHRLMDCVFTERDGYKTKENRWQGRPLVTCRASDDILSINEQMVMRGAAVALDWPRTGYVSPYHVDEALARGQRLGLWSGSFKPPARWRWERRR